MWQVIKLYMKKTEERVEALDTITYTTALQSRSLSIPFCSTRAHPAVFPMLVSFSGTPRHIYLVWSCRHLTVFLNYFLPLHSSQLLETSDGCLREETELLFVCKANTGIKSIPNFSHVSPVIPSDFYSPKKDSYTSAFPCASFNNQSPWPFQRDLLYYWSWLLSVSTCTVCSLAPVNFFFQAGFVAHWCL